MEGQNPESCVQIIANCTTPGSSSVDSVLQRKVQDDTWVQCENPKCLKWRRINKSSANSVSDIPWYCFMNNDHKFSSCEDNQEDYKEFEKLAKRCKLKYVSSALQEGTLVWARMAGYCSWPGIITSDPITQCYMAMDMDGHPSSYHIEFLGEQHSHGWVNHRQVHIYGVASQEAPETVSSSIDPEKPIGKKRKSSKVNTTVKREIRKSYKGKSVEFARAEADKLVDVLQHERLASIVFKYVPNNSPEQAAVQPKLVSAGIMKRRPGRPPGSVNKSSPKKRKLKVDLYSENLVGCFDKQPPADLPVCISPIQSHHQPPSISISNQNSPLWLTTGTSLHLKLNESASLQGRSKEEKFALDVEMNQKNQDGFDHDLTRFMKSEGLQMSKAPCWKDIPVTFYQIFVAVHERGGFHQVTANKQWAKVYKEVTNNSVSNANNVRKLYWKNLLPYELFVSGKDYKQLVSEIQLNHPMSCVDSQLRKKARRSAEQEKETIQQCYAKKSEEFFSKEQNKSYFNMTNKPTTAVYETEHDDSETDSGSEGAIDDDMKIMFQEIQETGKMLTYDILENSVKKDSERMNLSIKFYDDDNNPRSYTTMEKDNHEAQMVPELNGSAYHSQNSSHCYSVNGEHVLNEMQLLQKELDAMKSSMTR